MMKTPNIKYRDVYNQVTGEYFPKLIDTASAHVEAFPIEFNFVSQNTWEATIPQHSSQIRYSYHMYLTTEWDTLFTFKLKNWWSAGYPIMFNYGGGLQFGKIIGISSDELVRPKDEITVPNKKKSLLSDMGIKTVTLLEVVELTSLEYCELLETHI